MDFGVRIQSLSQFSCNEESQEQSGGSLDFFEQPQDG